MKKYELYRETVLPISVVEAWDFFSNPSNLAKITPVEMEFKVVTKDLPEHIHNGLMIEYVVRPLAGIPLKWLSQISAVNAPFSWPNNSESMVPSGIAPQLTAINGLCFLGESE